MAAGPSFRPFTLEEARYCINTWHYSADFQLGKIFYGAELNGEIIAAVVYDKCRADLDRVGELIATVRNPQVPFQMSQLLAYSRRQLKPKFDLLITFFDNRKSKGSQAKGDWWKYHGIVKDHQLTDFTKDLPGSLYLFWIPLNEAGKRLACDKGFKELPYPTCPIS